MAIKSWKLSKNDKCLYSLAMVLIFGKLVFSYDNHAKLFDCCNFISIWVGYESMDNSKIWT
jgi:hypothetical protein